MSELVFDDFEKLILFLNQLIQNNNNIYRGYSYDEEIYPNIIRMKDLSMYEEDFLTQFERYGLAYFSANNAMEFLSTAQHYGLPTRLVDFTYNPYIALFFALYNEKNDVDDQYYKIIYCDVKNCVLFDNEKNPSIVDIYKAKSKNEHFLESEYSKRKSYTKELITRFNRFGQSDKLHIVKPSLNNQRIIMQQGLFLIPTTLNKNKHKQLVEKNTKKILIDKCIRNEIIKYLEVLGFNTFRLMPDLTSVCYAIKKSVIEEVNIDIK